jgi:hypothetical protein
MKGKLLIQHLGQILNRYAEDDLQNLCPEELIG